MRTTASACKGTSTNSFELKASVLCTDNETAGAADCGTRTSDNLSGSSTLKSTTGVDESGAHGRGITAWRTGEKAGGEDVAAGRTGEERPDAVDATCRSGRDGDDIVDSRLRCAALGREGEDTVDAKRRKALVGLDGEANVVNNSELEALAREGEDTVDAKRRKALVGLDGEANVDNNSELEALAREGEDTVDAKRRKALVGLDGGANVDNNSELEALGRDGEDTVDARRRNSRVAIEVDDVDGKMVLSGLSWMTGERCDLAASTFEDARENKKSDEFARANRRGTDAGSAEDTAAFCGEDKDVWRLRVARARDGEDDVYNSVGRRSITRVDADVCLAKGDLDMAVADVCSHVEAPSSIWGMDEIAGICNVSSSLTYCRRISGSGNVKPMALKLTTTLRHAPGPLTTQRFRGGPSNATLNAGLRPRMTATI